MFKRIRRNAAGFYDDHAAAILGIPVIAVCFLVMACNSPQENTREDKEASEYSTMSNDMNTQGYTDMGKTPDGKPLYMKEVKKGYVDDRVYFTDDAITAHEYCGKNCYKNITALKH